MLIGRGITLADDVTWKRRPTFQPVAVVPTGVTGSGSVADG
jgi:hypothetical protein